MKEGFPPASENRNLDCIILSMTKCPLVIEFIVSECPLVVEFNATECSQIFKFSMAVLLL